VNYYHTWFNLKPGTNDLEFSRAMTRYMEHLKEAGRIDGWRLTRRKLGFGPKDIGEFHIVIETRDLAQLDAAFSHVATRSEPVESVHFDVNSKVQDLTIALYRDFPDSERREGEEKF
jgi:Family of unknown function (DUF6614)